METRLLKLIIITNSWFWRCVWIFSIFDEIKQYKEQHWRAKNTKHYIKNGHGIKNIRTRFFTRRASSAWYRLFTGLTSLASRTCWTCLTSLTSLASRACRTRLASLTSLASRTRWTRWTRWTRRTWICDWTRWVFHENFHILEIWSGRKRIAL